jgi:TRAP transporter 4TM/12TM fusion protein
MNFDQIQEQEEKTASDNFKQLSSFASIILKCLAAVFVLFHIYTAFRSAYVVQTSIHFLFALTIVFLIYPFRKKDKLLDKIVNKLDIVFALLAIAVNVYFIYHQERIIIDLGYLMPTQMDKVMAVIIFILVLEGARRALGLVFPILALIGSAYAVFGSYLNGIPFLKEIAHQGFTLNEFLLEIYMGQQGIFQGVLLAVGAKTVAIFIIFGSILLFTGGGEMFIRLSTAIAGRLTGGPAKVSTLASGLFGSISGSTAANTATTGVFTIPLMKRYGYKPKFAAAVEAAASCGGQILPPIMGAAAFVLAEVTRTSYLVVAGAALIPALLYYFSVWMAVHFEAKRLGLKPVEQKDMPRLKQVIFSAEAPTLFLPLIILVALLVMGFTPVLCAFFAVMSSVVLFLIDSLRKGKIKDFFVKMVQAFEDGAKTMAMIAVILATAQIIATVIGITGIGNKISNLLVTFGDSALILTLFFGMIVTIIMGMGVPTVAAYMLSASVIYPAFAAMGLPILASHLFILYYAILSGITPPVALAAYIGASISGSKSMETAITACKIGLAGFLIPYMFLFNPALLGQAEPLQVVWAVITAIVGVTALAGASIGYLVAPVYWFNRIILLGAALTLITSGIVTDIIGFGGIALVAVSQWIKLKRNKEEPEADEEVSA